LLIQINIINTLSSSVFQNVGLIAVLLIFIPKWYRHETLEMARSMGLLAVVFYLFFGVNNFAYMGLTTL
jgi:hypothetical protein